MLDSESLIFLELSKLKSWRKTNTLKKIVWSLFTSSSLSPTVLEIPKAWEPISNKLIPWKRIVQRIIICKKVWKILFIC
jgi:hypothetical protein